MTITHSPAAWRSFGPGILFAGAAIGTSHLVQSTRAGAVFGLGLLGVIILVNIIRYPGFRFAPYYTAVTGHSVIDGYRRRGRFMLGLLMVLEIPVQGIIIAATALTSAALALAVFNLAFDVKIAASALIVLASATLYLGGFKLLEYLTKFFVVVLTVTTVIAAALALPSVVFDFTPPNLNYANAATFAFIIALSGFMPGSLDLSIMQSVWAMEKTAAVKQKAAVKTQVLDFNFGYISTALLALCFLVMGAGVLNSANIAPADSAPAFAKQVISLYTSGLGEWSGIIVGIAAFGVMFSTLITVLDGMPRMQAAMLLSLRGAPVEISQKNIAISLDKTRLLLGTTILLSGIAIVVLMFFMKSFKGFIDFVTISAFLVGPFIAALNHLAVHSTDIPKGLRPHKFLTLWSVFGIVVMSAMSLAYIYVKFF